MSAAALAEYLIMKPDQQETVLHNSRFSSPPVVTPHQEALVPIRAYCSNPSRPKATLAHAKVSLLAKAGDLSIRPKAREESLRCVESIERFEMAENAFGLGALRLAEAERFPMLMESKVAISVQPDLIIQPGGKNEGKVGVILFRPHKAPDPESCRLEETKRQRGEHRREMARYMLTLAQMMFDEHGQHLGRFCRELSFVADIRAGERVGFPTSDHAARVRAVKAACRQISALWSGIEPRKSVLAKEA